VTTTDDQGRVTERYSYDPYGKRRYTYGAYDATGALVFDWSPSANFGTARGFTGHEQLDDIGITNMNGRLFDPNMGLFIQADSEITNPHNLQSYNRYAYTLNNPLNATDPTGFDIMGTDMWKTDGDPMAYNPVDSYGISQFGLNGADLSGYYTAGLSTTGGSTSVDTGAQNNSNQGDPGTQGFGQAPTDPMAAAPEGAKSEPPPTSGEAKPDPAPAPDVPTTCEEGCNRAKQMNEAAIDTAEKGAEGMLKSVDAKIEASGEVKAFGQSKDKKIEVPLMKGKADKFADPTGKAKVGVDKVALSLKTPAGSKVEISVKVEVKAKWDPVQWLGNFFKSSSGLFTMGTLAGFSDTVSQTSSKRLEQQVNDAEQRALSGDAR